MTPISLPRFVCRAPLAALIVAAALLGCSGGNQPPGDTLVTVDGVAIAKASLPAGDGASEAQRKAQIEALITEQLLANAAVAEHREADPATAAALASARRQVLAQAYRSFIASKEPVANEVELKDFFEAHPELFSQRKIYRVQELAIEAPASGLERVVTALRDMKTLGQRAEWLKKNGVRFETRVVVRPAEDWPSDLLPQLFKMPDGTAFDLASKQGFSILQLTGTEDQPLTFEQAKPSIAAFVNNQRLAALLKREQERLRANAKIEFPSVAP